MTNLLVAARDVPMAAFDAPLWMGDPSEAFWRLNECEGDMAYYVCIIPRIVASFINMPA